MHKPCISWIRPTTPSTLPRAKSTTAMAKWRFVGGRCGHCVGCYCAARSGNMPTVLAMVLWIRRCKSYVQIPDRLPGAAETHANHFCYSVEDVEEDWDAMIDDAQHDNVHPHCARQSRRQHTSPFCTTSKKWPVCVQVRSAFAPTEDAHALLEGFRPTGSLGRL